MTGQTPEHGPRRVVVWVAEGTWPRCVDAARWLVRGAGEVVLLHVTPGDVPAAAHHAYAGLLGRGRGDRDPGARMAELAGTSAAELLAAAAGRLGAPCTPLPRSGRVESEVVTAAAGADLLIMSRDGDLSRLGPKSLGRQTRFVVDHAPCPVLLVWPVPPPELGTSPDPGKPPKPPKPPKPHGHHDEEPHA